MKKALTEIFNKKKYHQILFTLLLLILAIGFLFRSNFKFDSAYPKLTEKEISILNTVEDSDIISVKINDEIVLNLEVAKSQKAKEKGLQFRETLNSEEGMVFIWEDEEVRSFWMKNTLIPLDIIFLDKDFKVVKIHKNTLTNQTTKIYSSLIPSKYVIELNAFKTNELNIREGDHFPLLALESSK